MYSLQCPQCLLCSWLNANTLSGNVGPVTVVLAGLAANGLPGRDRVCLNEIRLEMNYLTGSLDAPLWDKFVQKTEYWDSLKNQFMPRSASFGPQSCFEGTYRQRASAITLGECFKCTAGHYCDWRNFSMGLGSPKPCPEGTYRREEGADDRSQCESISADAC